MSAVFDQNWHRVVGLQPRLRLHAAMHRQVGRGGVWYVMQDNQTGRHFRVSAAAHAMLSLMDGHRTLGEIFGRVARHLGADRPSQGETVQLLVQLHRSDLLATSLPPDLMELDRRASTQRSRTRWATLRNPLALRLPLWAPDRFLTRTAPFIRPLCHPLAAVLAVAIVLAGAVLAAMNWAALASNVADRVFASDNVLLLALLYPVAKALHEAGHAYAVKLAGGDVPEVGLMILVLFPVPYVDASASAAFPDAWRRILVSGAGMAVELVIAGLASIAWTLLDPGPARATALDLMLLCGVSTLLFNGNPLLRFDGYYMLCDLIAIPNLDTRARKHLLALLRRHVLGMTEARGAAEAPGEAGWLSGFGLLSTLYRLGMMVSIVLIISTKLFFVGIALAAGSLLQMVAVPLWRALRYLLIGRELQGRRTRALLGVGGLGALLALLLFLVPAPHALIMQGAVWIPLEAVVRAGADGVVSEISPADVAVQPGAPLFRLDDPVAAVRLETLVAEVAVQRARFDAVNQIDPVQARLVTDEVARSIAAQDRAQEQLAGLNVLASRAGMFVVPQLATLRGRFVHKGDVLGYVLGGADVTVHAVVPQAELELVRGHTVAVGVLLASDMDHTLPARMLRQTPSALEEPPAPALAQQGGGPMLLDPQSPHHNRPLDRWYEIEVAPDGGAAGLDGRIGEHAAIRFDLGTEPLGWRMLRSARQAVLHTFGV